MTLVKSNHTKSNTFLFCFLVCLPVIFLLTKCPSRNIHYFYRVISRLFYRLNNSSLTLHWRAQPFFSGRCRLFRDLHLDILISHHPASSLFETQHQYTHLLVKKSTLPLRKMSISQGVLLNILFTCYHSLVLFDLVFIHITH